MIDLSQFVNETVIVTYENGDTYEGIVYKRELAEYPFEINEISYIKDGYYWESKVSHPRNIKSIKLKEESMIDLSQFVDKKVIVTYEDGDTYEGVVYTSLHSDYPFKINGRYYIKDGYYLKDKRPYTKNIKSINLKEESMNLQQQIEETQKQLAKLQEQLEKEKTQKTYDNCSPGDTVFDYLVVDKKDNLVLIANIEGMWSTNSNAYSIPMTDGWFMPTSKMIDQLFKVKPEFKSKRIMARDKFWIQKSELWLPLDYLNTSASVIPFKLITL